MRTLYRAVRLRHTWVITVAVCLCALALRMQTVSSAYRGNLWSLQVAYGLVQPGTKWSELPPILTDHPRFADWQALSRLKQGRSDSAIASLMAATGKQRADGLYSGILAISLQQDGQLERAVEIWRSLGAYQRLMQIGLSELHDPNSHAAVQAFRAAWELDSVGATAHLAEAFMADGASAEAEQLLRQALDRYSTRPETHSWRMVLGVHLIQQGRCTEAISVYKAATRQSLSCGECRIRLGQALYCAGKGIDAAKAEIEAGIYLDPQAYLGYFALGQMYEKEKRYAEAETWLGQALTFFRGNHGSG